MEKIRIMFKAVVGMRNGRDVCIAQDPNEGIWMLTEDLGDEEGGKPICIGDYCEEGSIGMTDLQSLSDDPTFSTLWSKAFLERIDVIAYAANSAIADIWRIHDNYDDVFSNYAALRAANAIRDESLAKIKRELKLD